MVALGLSDELMAEFLRGYFTGDRSSAGSVIEASTKSKELSYQLLHMRCLAC